MWDASFESLAKCLPGGDQARLEVIDDPASGRLASPDKIESYLEMNRAASIEQARRVCEIARVVQGQRVVAEYECSIILPERVVDLPIAVVAEVRGGTTEIRIYHSQWPLLGRHQVRPRILPTDPSARPRGAVGEYFDALAAGDVARTVATYGERGCFREPAGSRFLHRRSELCELYTRFFSAGGGIPLEHCTVTEDEMCSALEYTVVRWGSHALPPQAGVAVHTLDTAGKIEAAHVYDDVAGPVE